jgi:hypothetical protein
MSEGFFVTANAKREEILGKKYKVKQQLLARRKTINLGKEYGPAT